MAFALLFRIRWNSGGEVGYSSLPAGCGESPFGKGCPNRAERPHPNLGHG